MLNICEVFPIRKNLIRNIVQTPLNEWVSESLGYMLEMLSHLKHWIATAVQCHYFRFLWLSIIEVNNCLKCQHVHKSSQVAVISIMTCLVSFVIVIFFVFIFPRTKMSKKIENCKKLFNKFRFYKDCQILNHRHDF